VASVRDLSPAAVIAAFLEIPEATIRWWAHKGHIRRRGTGPRGIALYDAREVAEYAYECGRTRWKPPVVA